MAFLDAKIAESPNGPNEEVDLSEWQLLRQLMTLHRQGTHDV